MGNVNSNQKEIFVETLSNDIVRQSADVITALVDTSWDPDDEVIKSLAKIGGNQFISEWQRLRHAHGNGCQVGDVFKASSSCNLNCRHLLFAVWKEKHSTTSNDEQIKFVVDNMLCRAKELDDNVFTIVIPVGITGMEVSTHVKIINNVFLWMVQFQQRTTTHIHFLATNGNIASVLREALESFKDEMSRHSEIEVEGQMTNRKFTVTDDTTHLHEHASNQADNQEANVEEDTNLQGKPNDLSQLIQNDTTLESGDELESVSSEMSLHQNKVIDVFPEKESIWKYYTGTLDEFHSIDRKRKIRSVQFVEIAQEYAFETGRPVERTLSQSSVDEVNLDFPNFEVKIKRRKKMKPKVKTLINNNTITFLCPICQSKKQPTDKLVLTKCRHEFCKDCIKEHFTKVSPSCPICKEFYGKPSGNQPDGLMSYFMINEPVAGYPNADTIVIEYDIPNGIQTHEHPNPGTEFKGCHRTAFLPNTDKGKKVHRMLQKAFDQRLIFTVGKSLTTGRDNVVTWNDIHHKTRCDGGPERFGYPDPEYLDRVLDELRRAGITDE